MASKDESDITWKASNMKLMLEKKHFLEHPLLKRFELYLSEQLEHKHSKQKVENVTQFLYFTNPQEPSLEFMMDREKMKAYFCMLSEAKISKKIQIKHMRSLKTFLQYLMMFNDNLFGQCILFMDFLKALQNSKLLSNEAVQQEQTILVQARPSETVPVLQEAKKDFLSCLGRACFDSVSVPELTLIVYYLEAVVLLRHLQRPGVVTHMTTQDWLNRRRQDDSYIVSVKMDMTATQETVSFALDLQEESWFNMYYEDVRPKLLTGKRNADRDEVHMERFFISSCGKPIHNPSNDLNRLHSKYSLQKMTNQRARRINLIRTL